LQIIKGIKVAPGVVIGPVYYFERNKIPIPQTLITDIEVGIELDRFQKAIERATAELNQVRSLVVDHLDEDHAHLIDAQLMTLTDIELVKEVSNLVRNQHHNVLWAYYEVMEKYEAALKKSLSKYQAERLIDLHDVKKRVVHHLSMQTDYSVPQMREPAIYVGDRISPSDLIHIHHQKTIGIITQIGGMDSHAAILARAFGIPYLSDVAEIEVIGKAVKIILDADHEQILIDASPAIVDEYEIKIQEFNIQKHRLLNHKAPAVSRDGVAIDINLNAGFISEVNAVNPAQIKGIGLFRTEYLCLERNTIPDEEEQFRAYTQILKEMKGKPTTFRTFDFGREKLMAILDLEMFHTDTIFETWGGIRFCLDNPELLITQLRALLRASPAGPMRIMFPLVSNLAEIHHALALYKQVQSDLQTEGHHVAAKIPLGVMLETRTILEELPELTNLVDFFSVGTNDLALFLLGSKRTDTLTKNYYHPLIFQTIDRIVEIGRKKSFPITVCGEMASDPCAVLGLLALGVRSFSMSANALSAVSDLVRAVDIRKVSALKENLLTAESATLINAILQNYYQKYIGNGR